MSLTRRSARYIALMAMVAAAFAVMVPSAKAATPDEVCTAFPHRQTYVTNRGFFRAPAWHYDKTVTVAYDAATCTAQMTDAGNYVLSIAGTATVFEGWGIKGKQLDVRPFTSVLRSSSVGEGLGWPVKWWSCFEGRFSYVWTIQDIYSFSVTAKDGRWVMAQSDPLTEASIATSTNGCRLRSGN